MVKIQDKKLFNSKLKKIFRVRLMNKYRKSLKRNQLYRRDWASQIKLCYHWNKNKQKASSRLSNQ